MDEWGVTEVQASFISSILGKCVYDLKDKCRPMVITVVNNSEREILLYNHWIGGGKLFNSSGSKMHPKSSPDGNCVVLCVANGDGTVMTGCHGEFHFKTPEQDEYYCVAYSSPWIGADKARVVRSTTKPKDGEEYETCEQMEVMANENCELYGGISSVLGMPHVHVVLKK